MSFKIVDFVAKYLVDVFVDFSCLFLQGKQSQRINESTKNNPQLISGKGCRCELAQKEKSLLRLKEEWILLTKGVKVSEIAVGAAFAPTRFSFVRISI